MKRKLITLIIIAVFTLQLQAQRYVGGDISMLPKYEESNVNYYDKDGSKINDMITFLKDKAGYNMMRVRLFVNPTRENGVVQDLDYVKKLGKRIKDAGLALLLDFHYSDTWADPKSQYTPEAWSSLSDEQLYTKIYDYTKECLQAMKAAGATPDYIQTGNEISYGMLWGKKGASDSSLKKCYTSSNANWDRFRTLMSKAISACREEVPAAKIIIHTERTANSSTTKGIYTNLSSLDYDIIGLSYYPEWHNDLNTLAATINTCTSNFPTKDVMIVETGYYNNYYPSNATYNFTSTWPASAEGQKKFLDALVEKIKPIDQVKAILYWFPEENPYNNNVYNPWYNHGLFNPNNGSAADGLFSLKAFLGDDIPGGDTPTDISAKFSNLDFEQCETSGGSINTCPGWTINYDQGWGSIWPVVVNEWHSGMVNGNCFQAWVDKDKTLTAGNIIYQSVEDLPAGTYTIKANIHTDYNGIYLFANNDTQIVTSTTQWGTAYETTVTTTLTEPGTITLGLKLLDATTSGKEINLYADNFKCLSTTSGILNHHLSVQTKSDNAWYTLDGKRLIDVPSKKGLYIHKGKKVLF